MKEEWENHGNVKKMFYSERGQGQWFIILAMYQKSIGS